MAAPEFFFFCGGGIDGAKFVSEGGKNTKICQKRLIFDHFFLLTWASGGKSLCLGAFASPLMPPLNMKYSIGKSIFAVDLPRKLFRATVANADIGSLKTLHRFLKKCLYHMLVKFEQNRMVQITRNSELFEKRCCFFFFFFFYNHFLTKS